MGISKIYSVLFGPPRRYRKEITRRSKLNGTLFFKRSQSDALLEKTFVVHVVVHHLLKNFNLSNIEPS